MSSILSLESVVRNNGGEPAAKLANLQRRSSYQYFPGQRIQPTLPYLRQYEFYNFDESYFFPFQPPTIRCPDRATDAMLNLSTSIDDLIAHRIDDDDLRHAILNSSVDPFVEFLASLVRHSADIHPPLLTKIFFGIAQRLADPHGGPTEITALKLLYLQFPDASDRHHLLTRLVKIGTDDSLREFTYLIVQHPPAGALQAAAPFVPLFSATNNHAAENLFPGLLDGLSQPPLAAAILDVANFFFRNGQTKKHAASDRVEHLLRLTEAVVAHLERLQAPVAGDHEQLRSRQEQVAQGLPLAISLSDALALIGDDRAVPMLQRMAQLKHRRLRVESTAALIRLSQSADSSDPQTEASFLAMAAQPVVRLRVLAYAEELGILDRVAAEFTSPVAVAEAELVAYLTQPTQMGVPPVRCELIDSRTLYWPGYEELRNCYLFRFVYHAAQTGDQPTEYHSIGIVGPLVHAFHADLADLPIESIYSAFAGWQAEHEGIQEFDATNPKNLREPAVVQMLEILKERDFEDLKPAIVASFFDHWLLSANARFHGVPGVVVIDQDARHMWFSSAGRSRPIGTAEAYFIFKGQRLLRSFNADGFDDENTDTY